MFALKFKAQLPLEEDFLRQLGNPLLLQPQELRVRGNGPFLVMEMGDQAARRQTHLYIYIHDIYSVYTV